MYMAHVCFYVWCSDCVRVCGNVCCVAAVVKNSVFLAVLNTAFCMTCSLLMLVKDAIGDHTEEAYSRTSLITTL